MGSLGVVLVRGSALFFGVFSLANALGRVFGAAGQDVWWISLEPLPRVPAFLFAALAALLLIAFALRPARRGARRHATAVFALVLAGFATRDALAFFDAVDAGTIDAAAPFPFSAIVAVLFVAIALTARRPPESTRRGAAAGIALVALLWIALFPLAHIAFFGTTDYARDADAVVVLGARVRDDGRLSQSLADRVDRAIELHRQGRAPLLVMSGGVGANGIDETVAMRDHAVRTGVDPSAIVLDGGGVNTDATVTNTLGILRERGAKRVLVVSQFYHLPRIKMAYRAAGMNVYTVPALERRPIPKTPMFVIREVPAFWVYWARGLVSG